MSIFYKINECSNKMKKKCNLKHGSYCQQKWILNSKRSIKQYLGQLKHRIWLRTNIKPSSEWGHVCLYASKTPYFNMLPPLLASIRETQKDRIHSTRVALGRTHLEEQVARATGQASPGTIFLIELRYRVKPRQNQVRTGEIGKLN